MTVQLSIDVRNARLDVVERTIGPSAVLKIREGAKPSSCADADSGRVLATMTLPADWMADAANGSKGLLGHWRDSSADHSGTAGHFRIYAEDGATCGMQGTVTATAGGGDMTFESTVFEAFQEVNVTSFTVTDGNA